MPNFCEPEGKDRAKAIFLTSWVLLLALAVLLLLHLFLLPVQWWDHDEIEHLHASWLISQHMRPFTDFFEHHQPLFWYLFSFLPSETSPFTVLLVARGVMFVLMLFTLFLSFDIAKLLLCDARKALLAPALLASTWVFLRTSTEVRPDNPMLLLLAISADFFLRYLSSHRLAHCLLSSMALSLAFIFLHKGIALFPAIFLALLLHAKQDKAKRKQVLLHLLVFLTIFAISVGLMLICFHFAGFLDEYLFFAFTFTKAIQSSTNLSIHFSLAPIVSLFFFDSPFIFVLGTLGFFMVLKRLSNPSILFLATWLLGSLVLIAVSRMPNKQFFLPVFFVLSLFSCFLLQARPTTLLVKFVVAFSLVICAFQDLSIKSNAPQKAIISRILELTTPSDYIMVEPPFHPIIRFDATYLWFNIKDYLSAIEQMGAEGTRYGALMKKVYSREPKVIYRIKPKVLDAFGLREYFENKVTPDTLIQELLLRKKEPQNPTP
jgi:hypothetical protein